MPWSRFDLSRLQPVDHAEVSARRCARSDAVVAACRTGTEPFAVLQGDDPEVARRACLQLDGTWWMMDAGPLGRLWIRLRALLLADAWDSGWARDPAALVGFVPRRPTLIVVNGPLPETVGADLARSASGGRRRVRVLTLPA
jgi:hypothetical protein